MSVKARILPRHYSEATALVRTFSIFGGIPITMVDAIAEALAKERQLAMQEKK